MTRQDNGDGAAMAGGPERFVRHLRIIERSEYTKDGLFDSQGKLSSAASGILDFILPPPKASGRQQCGLLR